MEDMKPSVTTSNSADGDAIEARFTAFCKVVMRYFFFG